MTTSHAFFDSFSTPTISTPTMPRALNDESRGMSFTDFRATYSPSTGPIRLGSWESASYGAGRHEFAATFAVADTIHSATQVAFGPAEAITSMLHDAGIHIEITSFHQQPSEAGTVTFALCSNGRRSAWAMGSGATPFESTARAIVAGANRLY